MKNMSYTFVCIGTNKIVPDSFGPRVGDKLKQVFYSSPEISVYGTMQSPVHLKNAAYFLEELENKKQIILIRRSFYAFITRKTTAYSCRTCCSARACRVCQLVFHRDG